MPDNAGDVPAGDYTGSCNGCRLEPEGGSVLFCSHCAKTCGKRVEAKLDLAACRASGSVEFVNRDGTLKCEAPLPPNAEGLPEGTFEASCAGCSVADGTLTCASSSATATASWLARRRKRLKTQKLEEEILTRSSSWRLVSQRQRAGDVSFGLQRARTATCDSRKAATC
mmetsp:Transcript_19803/g.31620  ORF Transcript_19803/g.31620 Transcript_19803/m.31620 type:complete len:169 (-) Transcript_19803:47-553(-)